MAQPPEGLFKKPGSDIWHMRSSVNGKQQRQSSGTDSMKEAEDMLLHKRAGKEKAEKHTPNSERSARKQAEVRHTHHLGAEAENDVAI